MIRAVTNVVLIISDLDMLCSILFVEQVLNLEGFLKYGVVVHGMGLVTYGMGAMYFGPRQKFKVMNMVKDMMRRNPEYFICDVPGHPSKKVDPQSVIDPAPPAGCRGPPKFEDLPVDQDGLEQFKGGMSKWGLAHIWNFCENKNAKNTLEIEHGLPFVRLAVFGFRAEPTPKDLGCILNANALYTFCTGMFQLVFGAIMMAMNGKVKLQMVLPLAVSFISFLLSVMNVIKDFSGMLSAIEGERFVKEQFLQASENDLATQKRKELERRDALLQQIEDDFGQKTGGADLDEKMKRRKEALEIYYMNTQQIQQENMNLLQMELILYRYRLQSIKDAENGKAKAPAEAKDPESVINFRHAILPLENQRSKINEVATEDTEKLDPRSAKFSEEFDQIQTHRRKRIREVEVQIANMREEFAVPGQVDHSQGPNPRIIGK